MTVKTEDGGTDGMSGEKSVDSTIEVTKRGSSIDMGRLKNGSSNEVLTTEVLVVSKNVEPWVWLNPIIGARRLGIFLSEPVSWSICGGWREAAIEVIGLRTLSITTHSLGMEEWNYALCLIQVRRKCVSDIVI